MNRPAHSFPDELTHLLGSIAGSSGLTATDLETLPPFAGSYLLAITLARPFDLAISTLPATRMPAGFYVYCGSARGSGGVRARLKRHLSLAKKPHWHIDRLTRMASAREGYAIREANECDLAEQLRATGLFSMPVNGFGASDCRICDSHLLLWRETKAPLR